jgi:hypothetical protein
MRRGPSMKEDGFGLGNALNKLYVFVQRNEICLGYLNRARTFICLISLSETFTRAFLRNPSYLSCYSYSLALNDGQQRKDRQFENGGLMIDNFELSLKGQRPKMMLSQVGSYTLQSPPIFATLVDTRTAALITCDLTSRPTPSISRDLFRI